MQSQPSAIVGVEDELAAYCLDGATVTLGTVIENALMEMVEIGSGDSRKSTPRYTLKKLLDDDFELPREGMGGTDIGKLKGAAGAHYDEVGF